MKQKTGSTPKRPYCYGSCIPTGTLPAPNTKSILKERLNLSCKKIFITKENEMTAEILPVQAPKKPQYKKVLGALDTFLFTICALLCVDTVAPMASMGPTAITWFVILVILFFIPYGLIVAELGSTYPEQGGIYAWVKRAFGNKWGARTSWLYWVNMALWVPSSYIFLAGLFSQLFFPGMSLVWIIVLGLVFTWLMVLLGIINLGESKWVVNVASVLKIVLILGIILAGIIYVLNGSAPQNDVSLGGITPVWGDALFFLPAIIYSLLGFEMMSGASEEMKNPKRDVPRAIITAALFIGVVYTLAIRSMLVVIPVDSLGLITGMMDTFWAVFGTSGIGGVIAFIFGLFALYAIFAQTVSWAIGTVRTSAQAGQDGELPAFFGKLRSSNQAPIGSLLLTGIVASVVLIIYGFLATNAEDLFWTLFAFSSILFFIPYAILFPAFLALRVKDKAQERAYKVPGGTVVGFILAIICEIIIIGGILFFIYVPGEPIDWAYAGPVLIGIVVTLIIGEILLLVQGRKNKVA
ncbi:MAG: APC family permease [Anaerolineae bacterium]|nr:APC family permease [Anaerolineae bacterium]